MPQHPLERIVNSFQGSLQPPDALRRAGTSRTGIVSGPMPGLQLFEAPPGQSGMNSALSMSSGFLIANAPRLINKGRGQGGGM